MLFLIIIGVLVGPVLKLFEPSIVMGLAPYIAALALVFILFDGGMSLNIRQVLSHSPRAVLLAVLGFIFSMFAVALFMIVLYRVPLYYGLLFGSIYGGSSSIVVVSLASKIHVSEKCSTTLILESATTDILCIVMISYNRDNHYGPSELSGRCHGHRNQICGRSRFRLDYWDYLVIPTQDCFSNALLVHVNAGGCTSLHIRCLRISAAAEH